MHVRPATGSDDRALARSRYAFRREFDDPVEHADAFVERAAAWIAVQLDSGRWHAWVLEDRRGGLAGHAFVQLVEKVPNPVPEPEVLAYLTNVYVHPEDRDRGWGTRLVEAAVRWCRSQGVDTIVTWPSTESRPLYERQGFQPPSELLELALAEHPGRSGRPAPS